MPASAATGAQTFATADEGVEKLAAAVRVDDRTALRAVLGPGSEKLLNSGDKVLDAQRGRDFLPTTTSGMNWPPPTSPTA